MADLTEAQQYQQALQREYNTYVAVEAIDVNGARAFNPGHPVPVSHVENGIVPRTSVVKVDTKAAKAAQQPEPTTQA
jgi:hypothetical protein